MNNGRGPKDETIKNLLEKSGNQCAFPGCCHPILNERNLFIAKLVTINKEESNEGERYDPDDQDASPLNKESNLLFLCYRHYIETQDPAAYSPSILLDLKDMHERTIISKSFQRYTPTVINTIKTDLTGIPFKTTEVEEVEEEELEVFEELEELAELETLLHDDEIVTIAKDDEVDPLDIIAIEQNNQEKKRKRSPLKIEKKKKSEHKEVPKKEVEIPVASPSASSPSKVQGEKKEDDSKLMLMEQQFVELKKNVEHLLTLVGEVHKSDLRLNKDLKSLIESIDVLGVFTWRFRQVPFSKNPFINRNHETVHVRIPDTSQKVKRVIQELEMNVLGKLAAANPIPKEEIREKLNSKKPQQRSKIVVKSIRYADDIQYS